MTQNVLSPDTQATLLLISRLRQSEQSSAPPLRPSEYLNLLKTLRTMGLQPSDLFDAANMFRLSGAGVADADRISALFSRGLALALALEKWAAQGIWVLGWNDPDYPTAYKEKLKGQAPPVLYGIGDRTLLKGGGLAVVGSRNVDEAGIAFAHKAAQSCAENGVQVVSGAARGVDSEAMLACLDSGGQSVGILADSLARQAVSGRFREAIVNKSLVLISPFEPEARFFIGSAMARNKLIYTLADFALVISSDHKKGGTWAGALENLEKGWTPLFVRSGEGTPAGNQRLIEAGALPISEHDFAENSITDWMRQEAASRSVSKGSDANPPQGTLTLF